MLADWIRSRTIRSMCRMALDVDLSGVQHGLMPAARGKLLQTEPRGSRRGRNSHVNLVVNGISHSVRKEAPLLVVLRDDLGLTGTKPGCGEGECGSCTVLVDGEPLRACQHLAGELVGKAVMTIEGLATAGELDLVQRAFVESGAVQCGYCTPGVVLTVVALLAHDWHPTDEVVNQALAGNICRCGTYWRLRSAVQRAARLMEHPELAANPPLPSGECAWEPADPRSPGVRPARPWDMTDPGDRDWFAVLGNGLVVVLAPRPSTPRHWAPDGGAWLHISEDGAVTAFTGKVDVGQDNRTALRLLVAEELRIPVEKIRLAMGDTDLCPYDMGTFGSRSMPDAGRALSRLAAFARTLLPMDTSSNRVETVTGDPVVTPPTEWQIAGVPRVAPEAIGAVTGARRFVSDLTLPGLWHGVVLRAPALGARLRHLDSTALNGRSDVRLVNNELVTGVVARDPAVARLALGDLNAEWIVPEIPSEAGLDDFLRTHRATGTAGWDGPFHHEQGEPEAALKDAAIRVEATYTTAYISAAALETRVALAIWDDDGRLTIWTGTQTPFPVRSQVARALGVDEHNVRVIVPPVGGGFGSKHAGGVAIEAAALARAVGEPVRVAWTRREEFTDGSFRPAAVIDAGVGATRDGELLAWTFENINSGSHAIMTPYRVPNQRVDYRPAESPFRQASYRALAANANNFARESLIDELARRLERDPLEFRVANLDDERLVEVLRAAAERFGWTAHLHRGRGIACGVEKDGRVATVAEVLTGKDGAIQVSRLVTAYDCGAVVNPDTVINQIEGAAAMALGGALFEQIHFANGVITNASYANYRVPRIGDMPSIEVVLVNRPDVLPAGAGETPMIAVAPAIANAIFDATGERLRSLPLLGHR